jgi:hypothetical protein
MNKGSARYWLLRTRHAPRSLVYCAPHPTPSDFDSMHTDLVYFSGYDCDSSNLARKSAMVLCQSCRGLQVSNLVPNYGECYQLQGTYKALRDSAETCALCSLFHKAVEDKNQNSTFGEQNKAEYERSEDSNVWLISGGVDASVLRRGGSGMGISSVRVNVGGSTYLKHADLAITAEPGELITT